MRLNRTSNVSNAPSTEIFGRFTDYSNPDVSDSQIKTRIQRSVKATFTPNQGPYGRDKFKDHLDNLGILEELETCGATAQKTPSF